MIKTISRRLQQSINTNMVSAQHLALFVACIIVSKHSIASSGEAASAVGKTDALSLDNSTLDDKWSYVMDTISPLGTWLTIIVLGFTVVIWWKIYKSNYSNLPKEKKETLKEPKFFLVENWATISAIVMLGAAHFLMGNLFGHNSIVVGFFIVAVTKFFEHLSHRLLELPGTIDTDIKKAAKTLNQTVTDAANTLNQTVTDAANTLNQTVMDAVPKSLDAKRFFVTGTPHRKNVDGMLEFIQDHEEFKDSLDGISIFLFNSKPRDYAKVCEHFLKGAKQVESMTDMDFDKLLPLFKNDKEEVVVWVNKVNDRMIPKDKKDIKIKIHRVLVLTGERKTFLGALENLLNEESTNEIKAESKSIVESYSRLPVDGADKSKENIAQFIEEAKAGLVNFKANYCCPTQAKISGKPVDFTFNILAKESQEIGGIYKYSSDTNASYHDMLPRGEFIMFDRKYLVRFNSDAKLLEVLIGGILEEYAKVFSPSCMKEQFLLPLAHGDSFMKVELPLDLLHARGTQANGV